MKFLMSASSCALLLVAVSCSQPGPTATGSSGGSVGTTGSGGSTGTGSGGATSSGTGGSATPGTGGASSGSGGSGSGSGGSTSSGGSGSGSGGASTSTGGGTPTGGSMGTGGGGGKANTGGATSTGGSAPTGGAIGTGGGTATVNVADVVPQMDGFLWVGTCSAGEVGAGSLDCYLYPEGTSACPNTTATYPTQGLIRTVTQTVGGTPGTQYTVNFEVRGVVGSKCYTGGTRRAGDAPPANWNAEVNTDGWYSGGTANVGLWNTYEIHVSPPVGTANLTADKTENVYYLNSMPSTLGTTWCEVHETFPMQYTASFPVTGGGKIKFIVHDSNCKGQQNCGGPKPQNCTTDHRSVDLTGMSPQPASPPSAQPYRDSTGHYPQWLLFDVKTVTSP